MSNEPNAPSSDLARAAALSAGLAGKAAAAAPKGHARPDGEVVFTRLRARELPPPTPASPDAFGSSAWHELLDWAIATSASTAAFIVDRHGLVVDWRGAISRDVVEALGSGVAALLDAARRIQGPEESSVRALGLDLGAPGLGAQAVTVALAPSGLSLCLIGRRDVSRDTREALLTALASAGG